MNELTPSSFHNIIHFLFWVSSLFCFFEVERKTHFLFSLSGFSFIVLVSEKEKMYHYHNNIVAFWLLFLGVLTSPVHSKTASPDGMCSRFNVLLIIVVISIEKKNDVFLMYFAYFWLLNFLQIVGEWFKYLNGEHWLFEKMWHVKLVSL